MNKILIIAKKEFGNYLYNPIGFIFGFILLLVSSWLFWQNIFLSNVASLEALLTSFVFLLTIFIPALLMGSLAEEKKQGTWEVLLTLPVNEVQLVLGKFLGAWMSIAVYILCLAPNALIIGLLGKPDWGLLVATLAGVVLISGVYISLSIFGSSLSNQSVIAFVISATILMLSNLVGQDQFLSRLPNSIAFYLEKLSWNRLMAEFFSGYVSIQASVILMVSVVVFLCLSVLSLKTRHA